MGDGEGGGGKQTCRCRHYNSATENQPQIIMYLWETLAGLSLSEHSCRGDSHVTCGKEPGGWQV